MSRVIFQSFGQSSFVYGSERFRVADMIQQKSDVFVDGLNAVYKSGSDALKLLTRIHGQCEIHCWMKASNRIWVSNIIEEGLFKGVFLPNKGWENVIRFLRSNTEDPVVLSSSVCGEWGEIESRWDWEGSLSRNLKHLEISPDNWECYTFDQTVPSLV